jgi:hypothetical protein
MQELVFAIIYAFVGEFWQLKKLGHKDKYKKLFFCYKKKMQEGNITFTGLQAKIYF